MSSVVIRVLVVVSLLAPAPGILAGGPFDGAPVSAADDPAAEDPVVADWIVHDVGIGTKPASSAGAPASGAARAADDPATAAAPAIPSVERVLETIDRARRTLGKLEATLEGDESRALGGRLDDLLHGARAASAAGTDGSSGEIGATGDPEPLRAVWLEARRLARGLVFRSPLLDFDRILFVKRHPGRFAHMCDQYYGSFARPGGGLFILERFREGSAVARDVVGDRLPSGSFLSPDLSSDGRTALFAFARARRDAGKEACWSSDVCYHIWEVDLEGGSPRQLTDGPHDDFDPRRLPDGRIVFISTRRGGYCRCGDRPVPTYTLHLMEADGSGIRAISFHETNEWHPAILPDGRIAYTRWDYVDRHTNVAHSLWASNPDGSNPVALYGNYNFERKPWGEWHPTPIPGSRRLLAVAGAHHGYAHGSLVRIDPGIATDGPAAVTRLTPDLPFPEAEGYPGAALTTPFALDDDCWLASYSPRWDTRNASHEIAPGLYLMDSLGNRELLYRDPAIASMHPIPIRRASGRTRLPDPAGEAAAAVATGEGEFLVLDVYRSTDEIPRGAIASLRVLQVLPKTTYRNDDPKISVAKQISARHLLGTVPVEADGSAYFRAPAGTPLYFQAVGADGAAWQSMRTITYLQPGERRTCVGCHESRLSSPPNRGALAARRPPSTLRPGPDGTRPFSFPRLVQPVLDRRCVSCHDGTPEASAPDLRGVFPDERSPHTTSYTSLARKELVPWFDSVNGNEWLPRTYPGRFGARASRLWTLLRDGHEGVRLEPDELERIAIWIDLNVPFYGVYEPDQVAAQRAGDVVPPEAMLR